VQSALNLFEATKSELTTAAERNASYKAIMDKKFSENNAAISFLASGASLDTSAVSDFFTALDKNVDEFYNAQTNTWFNGLGTVLSTDMFGKTKILDWEGFVEKLNLSEAFTGTYEYQNAYSSYVDGII
jgi:peptidoglycan hydrolase-like protein with peptidoglycan-binding domain